jgi:hypothetical protein
MRPRRLTLKKETVRELGSRELDRANGATAEIIIQVSDDWFGCPITASCASCFCTWDCDRMTRGTNCCNLSYQCP